MASNPVFHDILSARRARCALLEKRYYHDRGWEHPYARLRREALGQLDPTKRILEVGCGRDFFEAQRYLGKTRDVWGVDPDFEPGLCPASDSGARIIRGCGADLPFADRSFDVIVCRSVIEHLPEPQPFFSEMARTLRPGGALLCLTPNRYDYVSIAAHLAPNRWHTPIVRFMEGRDEGHTYPTYYRANSERAIRKLASATGLRVQQFERLNHNPSYLTFSPLLYRLGIAYDRVITSTPRLAWLRAWLFVELCRD
ncbi:MAG TPA: class I SAM-dependent methyltransferase [Phycisphaerae bacterium]|nr:class I SAM-dependent methyltransferase [Phycisphaerae bacterium]HRW51451.1 class I SAM-dependent methyltransferase [Phycisphaerae bacterium]